MKQTVDLALTLSFETDDAAFTPDDLDELVTNIEEALWYWTGGCYLCPEGKGYTTEIQVKEITCLT